jgi:hypothetical protein
MENILHGTKQEESLSAEAVRFINNTDFIDIFRHIVTNLKQKKGGTSLDLKKLNSFVPENPEFLTTPLNRPSIFENMSFLRLSSQRHTLTTYNSQFRSDCNQALSHGLLRSVCYKYATK